MISICLNMIIKNEEKVLLRLLNSVLPIIDTYCIVDTGSTDSSKRIIKDFFDSKNISGEIHDYEFVNFEDARNYALNKAKGKSDFCFTIDADCELVLNKDFNISYFKEHLYNSDLGSINMDGEDILYSRRAFWRTSKNFKYKYPVHEVLMCDEYNKEVTLENISIKTFKDGNSWSEGLEKKYLKHCELIKSYIDKNGLEPRCVFYLAQSYKDAGHLKDAISWYEIRANLEHGYFEERYYSRLMIGKLKWILSYPIMEVADEFVRCGELDSLRAEHLYELKLMYERNGRPNMASNINHILSKYKNPYPNRALFINPLAYRNSIKSEKYLTNSLQELVELNN